jgi:two-component system response regulator AtoC
MSGKNQYILIVDDEPEHCFIISKALREEGYEPASAFSGEQALEMIAQREPDLVLLDIRMPSMDGVEVLTRIRKSKQNLCVIIVSSFEHISTAVSCMRLGAYDYLTKPINIHELSITVSNAFRTQDLQSEVERLKIEIERRQGLDRLIGESPAILAVINVVKRIAEHDISVLITGESGTGKEVVAEAIHALSKRSDGPFVSVDCAAFPEHLVESELFGFEKGAFTDAKQRRIGRFEMANGGVLFLDEIGNLPLNIQVKLLRVLQQRQLSRLGSKLNIPIDVRIVAATHVDLKTAIKCGQFREDLYYRLNEFNVQLPPLRERQGDIVLLAHYFMHRFSKQFGRELQGFSPEALAAIQKYSWSGNVRELQNTVKRAVILAEGRIDMNDLPSEISHLPLLTEPEPETLSASLKEITRDAHCRVEQEMISRALNASQWNKVRTAEMLQIDYKTLYNKLKEYQIE